MLTFDIVLELAGAPDTIAHWLGVTQPPVTLTLRGMAITLPLVVGRVTTLICRDLRRAGHRSREGPPEGGAGTGASAVTRYLPAPRVEEDPRVPAGAGSAVATAVGVGVMKRLGRWLTSDVDRGEQEE